MRNECIATAVSALLIGVIVPTGASARHVFTLSGTYSRAQVKKDCDAVGGVYQSDKGGYFCGSVTNGNSVNCNNRGKCTGSIPRQGRPRRTISGILHSPSGSLRSSGNGTQPNFHRAPAGFRGFKAPSSVGSNSQPTTIMRSASHYSGGRHR